MLAVRDLGEALRSAKQRSQKWFALQQLRTTDEHGVSGVAPYSPAAIAILEESYRLDDDDCHITHHLAIAYHAMAWDLELQGADTAMEAWEKALFYWQELHACGSFWQELYQKGTTLGKEFNRTTLEAFRQNLIIYLLEIHVDFIRHYYDIGQQTRASRHIELIKRARIRPAVQKKLEVLVYEAMMAAVPDAVVEGRFDDTLSMLDLFLDLFPNYIPALQTYLDTARQWIEQISPASQWSEIFELDKRVMPRWEVLHGHQRMAEHPLAYAALGNLARVLGSKHWFRARNIRLDREGAAQQPRELAGEEYQLYDHAISWLQNAIRYRSDTSEAQYDLVNALMSRATFVAQVGLASDTPELTYQLLEQALADSEEAMRLAPDEVSPRQLAAQLLYIKARHQLTYLAGFMDDHEFAAHLRQAESDLLRAMQLDPDNASIQEMLSKIRDTLNDLPSL